MNAFQIFIPSSSTASVLYILQDKKSPISFVFPQFLIFSFVLDPLFFVFFIIFRNHLSVHRYIGLLPFNVNCSVFLSIYVLSTGLDI